MADAECEVHPAMHAPDGGFRRGYTRGKNGKGGRSCARDLTVGGRGSLVGPSGARTPYFIT